MIEHDKHKEGLLEDFKDLQQEFLSSLTGIDSKKRIQLKQELDKALDGISVENDYKAKRAAELIIANLELKFLNEEKAKRAAELVIANIELIYQNKKKALLSAELIIANKELSFQNEEKAKRAAELMIANKELLFQNEEKAKRAAELIIANKKLAFENDEKEKRAMELIIANIELSFQNKEKVKRAAELFIANQELAFQNKEKEKRSAELVIANKELIFQNEEKEKRALELFHAKEKAEESDRLKSAFLANMSHEIRTPMNGILGFADLLREPELTGEMQQEYIKIIKKSGARMLNIINDIISISKIESGLVEANSTLINVNTTIEFIYKFFKPEMDSCKIHFNIKNTLNDEDAVINSDSEKLYSILTNLVKNALKHTEAGTIELGYVLKSKNGKSELEFFVKDTGIGIPNDRQMAIFERFIQSDISDKKAFQGAGLGLSISKAYVEILGGKIWTESKEGEGSTFYFTLPYETKKQKKAYSLKKIINKKGKKKNSIEWLGIKILIVEDDEISRILLTTLFKDWCPVVFQARTGLEAIAIFKDNPDIELILMDIQMPILNGFEATRQIRELNKNVVIIAQTASSLSDNKEKAFEAGCTDYISKPINKDKLFALVQKYFSNSDSI